MWQACVNWFPTLAFRVQSVFREATEATQNRVAVVADFVLFDGADRQGCDVGMVALRAASRVDRDGSRVAPCAVSVAIKSVGV